MKNNKKKVERGWHIIDASSETFGRVSSRAIGLLRGKNKTDFAPHVDAGDYVIFINSDKLKFTKDKGKQKIYYSFSGYPGGIKAISLEDQIKKDSREVIRKAIYRMLPKNKLRDEMIKRLKVYKDDNHPYKNKLQKVESL